MGADLIGTVLVIDKNKEPDWAAADKWTETFDVESAVKDDFFMSAVENYNPEIVCDDNGNLLDFDELSDDEKAEYLNEVRENIKWAVKGAKQAFEEQWRNTMYFYVRGAKVMILAETSWGDSPEGYDDMNLFIESGAALIAGFENE